MKIKDGFIVRKIAGKYMVVPVGSRTKELHGMIALNETAAFLWEKMEKDVTQEELVRWLLDEYEVSERQAKESVVEFVKLLQSEDVLDD